MSRRPPRSPSHTARYVQPRGSMTTAAKTTFLPRSRQPAGGGGTSAGSGPIDRFLDAVWMERGLSPNTLAAYRADLSALDRWLQTRGSSSLAAKRADVLAFI